MLAKVRMDSGRLKLADFWTALHLSWLRRLPYTKSVWEKLHKEEVGKLCFCSVISNVEDLEKAKTIIKNPIWRDIYCEFLTLLINKEPDLTAYFIGIQQGWSNGVMLHQVLDNDGNLCILNNLRNPKRPIRMEYDAFEKAISRKVEILKTHYNDDFCASL